MVKALKGIAHSSAASRWRKRASISFAVSCRHCEEPLCVKGCITGRSAIENGVIAIDQDKCVGCYTCILLLSLRRDYAVGDRRGAKVRIVHEQCVGVRRPASRDVPIEAIVFEER